MKNKQKEISSRFGEQFFGNTKMVENRFGSIFLLSFIPLSFRGDEKRGKNNQFIVNL